MLLSFPMKMQIIDICVYPENENQFCIAVSDNGIGISQEDIKNLSMPFQQLKPGTSKAFQGAGL